MRTQAAARAALLVFATFFFAGSVMAKDLTPATPQVDPWAGFFAGIHAGYGWGDRNGCWDTWVGPIDSCSDAPSWVTFDYSQAGPLFGGQVGYNWRLAPNLLLGVELNGSAASITGRLDGFAGGEGTWSSLVMATAKLGVTNDRWLAYVEGGYALANANFVGDLGCDFSMTHSGPVAGAGIGFKLSEHVSLDLKYDHVWLGAQDASCTSTVFCFIDIPTQIRTEGSLDTVMLGLNFKLGG